MPLFKGGQGRTPHDLRRDATSLGLTLLALAGFRLVLRFAPSWREPQGPDVGNTFRGIGVSIFVIALSFSIVTLYQSYQGASASVRGDGETSDGSFMTDIAGLARGSRRAAKARLGARPKVRCGHDLGVGPIDCRRYRSGIGAQRQRREDEGRHGVRMS